MLSKNKALSIARRWVHEQGHKIRTQVRQGPYSVRKKGRLVQVMYEDVATGKVYLLAKICVLDAGDVVVEKDRFQTVLALFAQIGVQTTKKPERVPHKELVAHFAEALTNAAVMPDWCLGFDVSPGLSHAADAVVFIRHGKARLELLVKVVASKQDKANYFRDIPSREVAHMYAATVTKGMNQGRIVQELVTRVEGMFANGSMKYLRRSSQ